MATALVTGGARGIGRAIGKALASAGFDVALASLESRADAEDALAGIRSHGRKAAYFQFDVADIASHNKLLGAVTSELGPLDCLVNNAGVTSLVRGDMLEATPESFDRCISINLRGTFFLTQAVARAMIEGRRGSGGAYRSIVTITSLNAGVLGLNRADYCISKAGLSMMSQLFAARLAAHNIHVFEVRPGIIRTEMTEPARATYDRLIQEGGVPISRWGTPEDVGATVAMVAGGQLPFSTGEVLHVGGGIHLHRV